jgi:hypothetical protein
MSRVINTNSSGKRRNQHMRTVAELLRHLSQKQEIDQEAKNMMALLVLVLREIADGIEDSTLAWEKRNYWIKIEEFRNNWRWAGETAAQLETIIINEEWHNLPTMLVKLLPYVNDITVVKFTRSKAIWQGCYDKLLDERDQK